MNLSPGDTIQIILTVGGVPYAKTMMTNKSHSQFSARTWIDAVGADLLNDIDLYADESAIGD